MDAGMALPDAMIPARDRVPEARYHTATSVIRAIDAPEHLGADELCWVMDRVLACEAAWYAGSSFSQTLYTCVYYYQYMVHGAAAPPTAGHEALQAFLGATLKGCTLAWHELMQQQLVDGEDFLGDTSSVPLPDALDVGNLESSLQVAAQRMQDEVPESHGVVLRLRFRQRLLRLIARLTAAVPDASEIELHAVACLHAWALLRPSAAAPGEALREPFLDAAPERVRNFFDVSMSRKLASHVPLRVAELLPRDALWAWWRRLLVDHVPLLATMLHTTSVVQWHELLAGVAVRFQAEHTPPFVRTLFAKYVSDGAMAAGGHCELEHLAYSLLEEVAALDVPQLMIKVRWCQGPGRRRATLDGGAPSPDSGGAGPHAASAQDATLHIRQLPKGLDADPAATLASRVNRFVQRLAGMVAQWLSTYVQNRARQRRQFGKAYATWADVADEAAALDRDLAAATAPHACPEQALCHAVHFVMLEQMRQALCAGFELELYAAHERAPLYWLVAQVAGEQRKLASHLAARQGDAPERTALQCRALEAAALERLSLAHAALWAPVQRAGYHQATFERRIKWLRRPAWAPRASLYIYSGAAPPPGYTPTAALFDAWQAVLRTGALGDPGAHTLGAEAALRELAVIRATAEPAVPQACSRLCAAQQAAWAGGLAEVCGCTRAFVERAGRGVCPHRWAPAAHPWFLEPAGATEGEVPA